jgi:hypothetical protein
MKEHKKKNEKSFLDIEKLKHEEINYGKVKKNFYFESKEVADMDPEYVKMLR